MIDFIKDFPGETTEEIERLKSELENARRLLDHAQITKVRDAFPIDVDVTIDRGKSDLYAIRIAPAGRIYPYMELVDTDSDHFVSVAPYRVRPTENIPFEYFGRDSSGITRAFARFMALAKKPDSERDG